VLPHETTPTERLGADDRRTIAAPANGAATAGTNTIQPRLR